MDASSYGTSRLTSKKLAQMGLLTVRLLRVESTSNPIIHGNERPPVLARRAGRSRDSLQQVGRAISRVGGSGAHAADDDDGLAAIDSQVDYMLAHIASKGKRR